MPTYLVERDLPWISRDQLVAAHRAAIETSRRFTAEGCPVRYTRSVFVLAQARCMCLFEAADAECVRRVNEVAQIPFISITEVLDLIPADA